MSDPTDAQVQFDAIIARYCAELVRLNYVRGFQRPLASLLRRRHARVLRSDRSRSLSPPRRSV